MPRFQKLRKPVQAAKTKLRPARRAVTLAGRKLRSGVRNNMQRMGMQRMTSLLALPALLLLIIVAAWLRTPRQQIAQFYPVEQEMANPLMGLALNARSDPGNAPDDIRLVWVKASWRELEPEEGVYTFDAFDEVIHRREWQERGVKLIFRLALDVTDSGLEKDIPNWLYEKTLGGEFYTLGEETCYAPDYSDPFLQERHLALLQAIEEHYGDDIAYVEMGSIGANGAWESHRASGGPALPMVDVTGVYIWQYFTAFPEHNVLAAGPYREAVLLDSGAYLNALGDEEFTWNWINRFRFGGWDDEIGAKLRPQEDFGLIAPAGAWLAEDAMLVEDYDALVRMARESRPTYLCVDAEAQQFEKEELEALDRLKGEIGYRFWVRQAQWPEKVRPDYSLYVDLCIANDGIAPFPQNWPVCLALLNAQGELVYRETIDANPHEWLPNDNNLRVRITMPADIEKGEYVLALAVCDPDTMQPAVHFAMTCKQNALWYELGSVQVY